MGDTVEEVLIDAEPRTLPATLREVWANRELLYFLVWRDVKVRYKQTAFGAAWVLLQPLLTMAIFAVVFGRFVGVRSEGVPYSLLVLTAVVPWQYVSSAVSRSSTSVVANANLVTKVYFPRVVIPLAACLTPLVDLFLGLVLLAAWLAVAGPKVTLGPIALLQAGAVVLLSVLTALSVSLWLAALNVRFRDVTYAVPFLLQVWMFLSPVAYPASVVPEPIRPFFLLNPVASQVELFRSALVGTPAPPWEAVAASTAVVLAALAGGFAFYHATEDSFADLV